MSLPNFARLLFALSDSMMQQYKLQILFCWCLPYFISNGFHLYQPIHASFIIHIQYKTYPTNPFAKTDRSGAKCDFLKLSYMFRYFVMFLIESILHLRMKSKCVIKCCLRCPFPSFMQCNFVGEVLYLVFCVVKCQRFLSKVIIYSKDAFSFDIRL